MTYLYQSSEPEGQRHCNTLTLFQGEQNLGQNVQHDSNQILLCDELLPQISIRISVCLSLCTNTTQFHLPFLCKHWFVLKFFFDMPSLLILKPSFFPFSYTSFVCFLFFGLSGSSSFSSIFVFLCTHHPIN